MAKSLPPYFVFRKRILMANVCQLFSGSSGNSIFLSSGGERPQNILVDIGVSAKRCEGALKKIGVEPKTISAIFVTHEHVDHISGVRVFAGRYGIPVFAEGNVLNELWRTKKIDEKVNAKNVENGVDLGEISVVPFNNSHDSVACVGYHITFGDGKRVGICTDTGYVTKSAKQALLGKTDMVFLESNYEPRMLEFGPYPLMLKKRIGSNSGHLSNDAAAEFALNLVENGTRRIQLCHLSKENNFPDTARQATLNALNGGGKIEGENFWLGVSKPENDGGVILL